MIFRQCGACGAIYARGAHCPHCPRSAKAPKYHAVKTKTPDGLADSRGEARRLKELRLLERAGEIEALEFHPPPVTLFPGIPWRLDFRYREGSRLIWEDFKGVETPEFRLKRCLWRYLGPGTLRVTRHKGQAEEVQPLGIEALIRDLTYPLREAK